MITREISVESDGVTLAGELRLPDGLRRCPIVLMVHGSGPLDRNENAHGQALNIFNTLADYLAASGIASFRYDKRGCGKSAGDYFLCSHNDLVADASACIDYLAGREDCDREQIFVLGHSEGTIIAAQLAIRHSNLAGLVLLCPFVEPMESILRRQAQQMQNDLSQATGFRRFLFTCLFRLFGNPIDNQEQLIAKLKSSDRPTFRSMFRKVNATWLRELLALDNERIYRQVTCPMLVLGGEKDIQCLPGDVQRIAEICSGDITHRVIADLTHLLRLDPDHHTFLGYKKLIRKPVAPAVCELVSQWIGSRATDD